MTHFKQNLKKSEELDKISFTKGTCVILKKNLDDFVKASIHGLLWSEAKDFPNTVVMLNQPSCEPRIAAEPPDVICEFILSHENDKYMEQFIHDKYKDTCNDIPFVSELISELKYP